MEDRTNWKENQWVMLRFERIHPLDVIRRLKKYYTYVRHARSPKAPDVACLFLYVVSQMLYSDGKKRYGQKDVMKMFGITFVRRYTQLLERHEKRILESQVYWERFLLLIRDLDKQEARRKKKVYESINVQPESEGISVDRTGNQDH